MTDQFKIAKFNDIDLNVFPYILRRDPTGIVNYIAVYQCSTSHPQYNTLKQILSQQFKHTKIGKGAGIDMLDTIDIKKYKHTMYYYLDLRKNPDTTLDPIIIKNFEHVNPWVYNSLAHELLNTTKGLIIFTDDISKVPPYFLSKSITGLTQNNLEEFLNSSCATFIKSKVLQVPEDNKLRGYVSGEKWTRLSVLE
jgi:hypothetical protein